MRKNTHKRSKKRGIRASQRKFKGLGMISVIFMAAVLAVAFGSAFFMQRGNDVGDTTQYMLLPAEDCAGKGLQLCTFRAVTYTPTPQPTKSQNSPADSSPKDDSSHNENSNRNNDRENGGNSSPNGKESGGGSGGGDGGGNSGGGGAL